MGLKNRALWVVRCVLSLMIIWLGITSSMKLSAAEPNDDFSVEEYKDYKKRLEGISKIQEIEAAGFEIVEEQIFPASLQNHGKVSFLPAFDQKNRRLVLFLVNEDESVVYRTDNLETNNKKRGSLKQPNIGIEAVSFQDLNEDGRLDIILITSCGDGDNGGGSQDYKVGDVLFQDEKGFYRDWRVSDKINRFGMNKSIHFIVSFVRDGFSTEFLYTASTLDELEKKGLRIIREQYYKRKFEKLGTLWVVPGTYDMADYQVFMIYLVNDQGSIVWSLQPMGDYDNLYALKGITCRDIDGDGQKDMVVLARYSYEGSQGEVIIKSDYEVYYQRTAGFYADTEFKNEYQCYDSDTMEDLVQKARAHWGWSAEE